MHCRRAIPEYGPGQSRLSPDGWGRGCGPDQGGHPALPAPWAARLSEPRAPGVTLEASSLLQDPWKKGCKVPTDDSGFFSPPVWTLFSEGLGHLVQQGV